MDDYISRQWLMECVNEGWIKFDTEKDENRFIHLVRDIAPSADIQEELENAYMHGYTAAEDEYRTALAELPHWIPVSERLPETPIRVQVQLDNSWIITAYYDEGKWYAVPDMYWGEPLEGVLAWQPLPTPWEEGQAWTI